MRALSLWQPWASLIAYGAKRWETRSWSTDYRGELLIHAAKRKPPAITDHRFIEEAIQVLGHADFDALPRGKVVAVCELKACYTLIPEAPDPRPAEYGGPGERELIECLFVTYGHDLARASRELRFGDWSVGRVVWDLENIRRLADPIPLLGQRGLFPLRGETLQNLDAQLDRAVTV